MKRKKRDEKRWEMVILGLYSLPFFHSSVAHHRLGHLGFTLSFNKLARRHCHCQKRNLFSRWPITYPAYGLEHIVRNG